MATRKKKESPIVGGRTLAEIFEDEESVGSVSARISDELAAIRRALPEHERKRTDAVRVAIVQLSAALARQAEAEYKSKLDWILIRLGEARAALDTDKPKP